MKGFSGRALHKSTRLIVVAQFLSESEVIEEPSPVPKIGDQTLLDY